MPSDTYNFTEPYQLGVRGLLMGEGTNFRLRRGQPEGLGVPATKTEDTNQAHGDGGIGGRDRLQTRLLTFAMFLDPDAAADAAEAMLAVLPVIEAWQPSQSDIELHMNLPGWGHIWVTGRPRGPLALDTEMLESGHIEWLARFECLDPTIRNVEGS